jgi:hypothetical protein
MNDDRTGIIYIASQIRQTVLFQDCTRSFLASFFRKMQFDCQGIASHEEHQLSNKTSMLAKEGI